MRTGVRDKCWRSDILLMKKLMMGLVFISLVNSMSAQSRYQDKYPFLDTEKNSLDIYGDANKFNTFFQKLDKIILEGDGQLNIVHMGGSHVQGGSLSHAIRKHMQSFAPGLKGQRGLLFPFDLAGTNNPWNYVVKRTGKWDGARVSMSNHTSQWGISGITATTSDVTSTVTIYGRESTDALQFDRVRIFYQMNAASFEPFIMNNEILKTELDTNGHFIEIAFSGIQDTLYFGLHQSDLIQNQFILQGIQFLSDGPAVVYNPIGVNGASTGDYLRSQKFTDQMKMIDPDLVIFGIGINDANTYARTFDQGKFERNYDSLIARIKIANPGVSIIFMTNNDSYFQERYPNPNAYKVRDAMIKLAKRHDAAVWDLFEIMGGFDSIRIWEAYGLARPDRIHFSTQGYELQAQLFFYAIREAYGDYLSARFGKQP